MSIDTFLLSADTTDLNYPEVRPTLDLNFARVKALDPRITFTRSSGGSYVGADGLIKYAGVNEARFDHNPTTGESLGLLVEEQRTNLLLRSEEFDNASWTAEASAITANTQVAPNGTTTADTLTATSGTLYLYQTITCSASTAYTFSFYVKLGTMPASDFRFAVRDDTAGAFIAIGIVPDVTPVTTEWRRVTYMLTTPVGCTLLRIYPYRFTVITGGTAFLWGAQLEAGAFPTSYIPTTAATVTRNADVASITGSAFSGWYRQDEGTVFAEGSVLTTTARWGAFNSIASFSECINFGSVTSGQAELTVRTPTTTTAVSIIAGSALTAGAVARDAFRYAVNDFAVTRNGAAPATSTSGNLPNARNTLYIGSSANTFTYHNGHIRRLTYWPVRLPNAQLQTLTR
jgi:hypothetical protein